MLQDWLAQKINRVRHRFDHHELSESSTPSTSSASSTAIKTPRQTRRSRSESKKLSKEMLTLLAKLILPKQEQAKFDGLLVEQEPGATACQLCAKRVAKFRCDPCNHVICKHCAYLALIDGINGYEEGPLTGNCTDCFRIITGFTRIRKCRLMIEEEPVDENSPSCPAECTISFNDYADSFLSYSKNASPGRVNRAFESSNSL